MRPRAAAVLARPSFDRDPLVARRRTAPPRAAAASASSTACRADAELALDARRRCWRVQPSSLPGALAPRLDRAVADRQVGVGHDQVGIDLQAASPGRCSRAHAERAVERERLRRQLGQADAAAGRRAPRCRRARAPRPRRRPAIEPAARLAARSRPSRSGARARSPSMRQRGRRRSRWCASSSCRAR